MRLSMVGTGYVGLVTGVCLANTGNDVACLDIDAEKVRKLRAGECPIYEPGLTELLQRNIKAGRLRFTTDPAEAHQGAQMIFICVGTPSDDAGRASLRYVHAAADDVADALRNRGPDEPQATIVVKSTVPVGTTLAVRDRIRERLGPDLPFSVANNPEFLKEGAAVNDFLKPDRVVCGVEDERTGERFRELYDPFVRNGHPVFVMDILSSEMVKYASNAFLATKISFINEMANLCEAFGADIKRVREGMCSDSRIGTAFLYPGLGYGGSCFPKDTLAVIGMGETSGAPTPVARATHEVNQAQRPRMFEKIRAHYRERGGLKGKTLAFWGLSFKPQTDDVREAPALTLIRMGLGEGVEVRAYDPVAMDNARAELPGSVVFTSDMYEAAKDADGLVISTDWNEFKSPDYGRLASALRRQAIFDGRNLYRRSTMAEHGFHYYCVGRAPVKPV